MVTRIRSVSVGLWELFVWTRGAVKGGAALKARISRSTCWVSTHSLLLWPWKALHSQPSTKIRGDACLSPWWQPNTPARQWQRHFVIPTTLARHSWHSVRKPTQLESRWTEQLQRPQVNTLTCKLAQKGVLVRARTAARSSFVPVGEQRWNGCCNRLALLDAQLPAGAEINVPNC